MTRSQLEKRVAILEAELARLKSKVEGTDAAKPWWERIAGTFQDDPVHEKAMQFGRRFAFKYEYDFGDSWEHEVSFEGRPPADPKVKYPLCVEGERACPPEDCGGVWGYGDFLAAIRNPKHKDHKSMLEWIGGRFDSDDFNANEATKAMKKGLPDWRSMR